jgi:hypothetical protein
LRGSLKQEIDTFIKQIRNLQSLGSILSIFQYNATELKQEDDLQKIILATSLSNKINEDLTRNISSVLSSNTPKKYSNNSIESDLSEIVKNVEAISSNSIPNKSEFLEILQSFQKTFSESNVVNIIDSVKQNTSENQNQLYMLEEICAHQNL